MAQAHGSSEAGGTTRSRYRPDIDGLRALSILLVVGFHVGLVELGGGFVGVDVFFVISGFLITGLLLDEARGSKTISFASFYARRMRRLLPLAALVLLSTLIAGMILLPPIDRAQLLGDARAAALYMANWRFGDQALGYWETGPAESLLVHFWSLSIEEQFYLVWPVLIFVVLRTARRRPERFAPTLAAVLGVLIVGSFWASIAFTADQGTAAYYATHLRIGELAVGAALALARPMLRRMSRDAAEVAGAAGLILIVFAAVEFSGATVFPGAAVLVPVIGTALIIASGIAHRTRVTAALSSGPLPSLGKVSYGWYLWHWPAIGVATILLGASPSAGARAGAMAAAVAISLILAIVSHYVVEQPVREARGLRVSARRSFALGAALTLVPVGFTFARIESPTVEPIPEQVRSVQVASGPPAPVVTPEEARRDRVGELRGCHVDVRSEDARADCVFGDPNGARTIALIGDSHAHHWFRVYQRVAVEQGYRLLVWTKSECPFTDVRVFNDKLNRAFDECARWRGSVLERLRADERGIDIVALGRSKAYQDDLLDANGERATGDAVALLWSSGSLRTFEALRAVAPTVLVIEDTPWAPWDVPSCLSKARGNPARCTFPSERGTHLDAGLVEAERAVAGPWVRFTDFTRALCPDPTCQAVSEEGLIIYRDQHHMTRRFSMTLRGGVSRLFERLLSQAA